MHFLKQHSREEGLFQRSGRRGLRHNILEALRKGERLQIPNSHEAAKECAAALQMYLTQMESPILPERVQQLLLADNPGITSRTIARDALGLIRQDVTGRHSELLVDLLRFLRHMTIYSPPSERTEFCAPPLALIFLPVFFNLTVNDLMKWEQLACRLNELIMAAPEELSRQKQTKENNESSHNFITRLRMLPLLWQINRLGDNARNNYMLA